MSNLEIKSFQEVTEFHGHVCPGSALGYVAAKAALEKLSHYRSPDEELMVIVENDSCAVDAVQVVSGCTMGKGNLIFKDHGKQVYTFFNRKTGQGVRLSLKDTFDINKLEPKLALLRKKVSIGEATEEEKKDLHCLMEEIVQKILDTPTEQIFQLNSIHMTIPDKARMYPSQQCSICGELVSEHRCRVTDGKIVCIPCYEDKWPISV